MPAPPAVESVTSVPPPAREDRRNRTRTYLLTMGVRTVCFALAFFTEGWLRWTCVALAVLLPYVAVVVANAVGPRTGTPGSTVDRRQITR